MEEDMHQKMVKQMYTNIDEGHFCIFHKRGILINT